jgi:D-sedoheptulose 7-phosphate isomerase
MFNSTNNFSQITEHLRNYFKQVRYGLRQLDEQEILQAVKVLLEANRRGATIFIFGNGGSAATATHFANDLAKGCIVEGQKRFRAIALTDNISLLTAWANDKSYDEIFAEQLRGLIREGDVVIGISGSGNSTNVLKGIQVAKEASALTIGFCGYGGGKLRHLVDYAIHSDCTVMEQVEDIHMALCHGIATTLRMQLSLAEPPIAIDLSEIPTPIVEVITNSHH